MNKIIRTVLFTAICQLNIFLTTNIISAQDSQKNYPGVIEGKIIDAVSNQPLEKSNFSLFKSSDSLFVGGTSTDKDGYYILQQIDLGNYYALISFLGYKTNIIKDIKISPETNHVYLDTIKLQPTTIRIDEVKVVGKQQNIIYEDDKIIVNVDKTMAAVGGNAIDILENTPMVTVDFDGNVSLMGRKKTKIYVDGISSEFLGFEIKDVLRALPSRDIQKIELITNPSPEYDAQGDVSVINIITNKSTSILYSGYLDANADTRSRFGTNTMLSYSPGKIIIRGAMSNNYSENERVVSLFREISASENISAIEQKINTNSKSLNNGFRFIVNYTANTSNVLSTAFNYSIRDINTANKINYNYQFYKEPENGINQSTSSDQTKGKFFSYSLAYMKLFEEKKRRLQISAVYMNNFMRRNGDYENILDKDNQLYSSSSGNLNNSIMFKTIYSHPAGKFGMIRGIYTGNFKLLNMRNDYYRIDNNKYLEEYNKKIQNKYSEIKNSFGIRFSNKILDYDLELGLNINGINIGNNETLKKEKYNYNYFYMYPSFTVRKEIIKNHRVTLKFDMGCDYPSNKQLNPYIDYSDSLNLTKGNLNLKPSSSFVYSLDYFYNTTETFLSAKIGYATEKNIIVSSSIQEGKTIINSYMNLAKMTDYTFYLSFDKTVFNFWKVRSQLALDKSRYYNLEYVRNNTRIFLNAGSIITAKDFYFLLDFNYRSPKIVAQEKINSKYYFDTSIKKSFWDRRLSVYIKVSDIFNSLSNNSNIYGSGFTSKYNFFEPTRIVKFGFTFYFQKIKEEMEIEDLDYQDDF